MSDEESASGGDPQEPTIVRRRTSDRVRKRASDPARDTTPQAERDTSTDVASHTPDTSQTIQDRTVAQAMLAEELMRARGFAAVAMFMVTLVGLQTPYLPGDPMAKLVAGVALAVMFVTSCLGVRARAPARRITRPRSSAIQGWVLATCILPVEYYVGFYSPMTVVLSLGIYYLGQSTDRTHAFWLPLYVTGTWVGGALLITAGVIEDRACSRRAS